MTPLARQSGAAPKMTPALTREEKVEMAMRLRGEGKLFREIAAEMGVAISTVGAWLTDPDGSRLRARKDSYRGTCDLCGAPTDGSNGRAKAPARCWDCIRWTQEEVLAAFRDFYERTGRSPRVEEAHCRHGSRYHGQRELPTEDTVRRLFGSWNDGLLAARLPLNMDRRPETQVYVEAAIRAGRTVAEIAADTGLSRKTIYERMKSRSLSICELRGDAPRDLVESLVVGMWQDGWTIKEISEALGHSNPTSAGKLIQSLRHRGFDLPYRRLALVAPKLTPPEDVAA